MKRRTLITTLVFTVLLTGCQSLPTSGPVTQFEPDLPDSGSLVLKGFGPVKDASPQVIVRDFLRASAAGWSDDFQVARTYLTEEAVKRWKPEAQVQIYSDAIPPTIGEGESEISVETTVEAIVTPDGQYSPQVSPAQSSITLALEKNGDEQWRISELPDGTIVSQSAFHTAYQLASVYFLSPDGGSLVSDPRWYPRRRLASYLMQALIEGPSPAIQSAVLSAVPEGARLPLQSVEITDGRAEVEIEGQTLTSEQQKTLFKWQVISTLVQVPTVSDVSIAVNGRSFDDVKLPTGPVWAMDTMIGISEEGLVVDDARDNRVLVARAELGDGSISGVTIGPVDSSPVAYLLDNSRLMLVKNRQEPIEIINGTSVSTPSIDRLGWVWTVAEGGIIVSAGEGKITIESPWKSGDPLVSLAVAPDGARALLRRGGTKASLWVAAVKRSQDGTPVGLEVPRRVEGIRANVVDMSWAGNTSAVALLEDGEDSIMSIFNLSSIPDFLRAPDDAIAISGGASTQHILVRTTTGETYTRSGNSWRLISDRIQISSYPR
ncbi:MAG: LpqB family beta-propeller domain-containing protein [Actinomycetaceae bacterium]|nr:LpqB family beta-propeller domain-containing protein [Actinomycetaceae bacterium]